MALPYNYRLTRTEEFSRVYQQGQQAATRHVVVKVLRVEPSSESPSCARFGISVSQKVCKRAVVRNRLKRQIRAALLTLLPRVIPGVWVVIVVRSPAIQCDYWKFLQELEQLFLQLELLSNGH